MPLSLGLGVGVSHGGGALAASPGALAAYEWWRGDGLAASPVSSWPSTGSKGNAAAQAVGANQPLWVATYAALGNQAVVHYDSTAKFLTAGAVADYKAGHDGTGFTLFWVGDLTVATAVRALESSQAGLALAAVGHSFYLDAANKLNFATGNGTVQVVAAQSTVQSTGTKVVVVRYSSTARAAGTRCEMRINRAVNGTSSEAATPSSANASLVLRLGFDTFTPTNREGERALWTRDLTDAEVARLESYALARYGV